LSELRAILLIGPTGAGKTPLGDFLEAEGLWQSRCFHFDFGRAMRNAVDGGASDGVLSRAETDFLAGVLRSGALLEDGQFGIAEKILSSFVDARGIGGGDLIILNGLPRHVGQAADVGRLVRVVMVACLSCSPEAVLERIRTNAGGDRAGRRDDGLEAVRRKQEIFHARTLPLVAHYRSAGVRVEEFDVTVATVPEDVARAIGAVGIRETKPC
jgi:adenylate kinase family enzyme